VVGAVVVALLLAQTVPVELEVEGAPSCPRPERVSALLADRPAGAGVEADPRAWRLRYRQERSAGAVQMELVDPTGQVAARRQMQVAPSECEAGAVAMVAVVERFFRGVAWTSGAPLPAATAALPAPAAAASRHRPEIGLGVNGALWLADAVRPRVAIGVHIVTPTSVPARLGVQVLLPPGSRVESLGGAATVSETVWPLRISAALARRSGPVRVWLGPDALIALGFGRSAGLPSLDSGTRLTVALGAAAALQLSLGRWQLVVDLAGHHHLAGKTFHVDAANGGRLPVLGSPAWQGLAALGLARAF
jgi:hypothetical protein